jgi:hypothetical protein
MPKVDLGKSQRGALVYSPPIILVNFWHDFSVSMERTNAHSKSLNFLNQFFRSFIYIRWNGQLTLEKFFGIGGRCTEADQLSKQQVLD